MPKGVSLLSSAVSVFKSVVKYRKWKRSFTFLIEKQGISAARSTKSGLPKVRLLSQGGDNGKGYCSQKKLLCLRIGHQNCMIFKGREKCKGEKNVKGRKKSTEGKIKHQGVNQQSNGYVVITQYRQGRVCKISASSKIGTVATGMLAYVAESELLSCKQK